MPLDQTNWSQTETETKPDLSKPSLEGLSWLLRQQMPDNFRWEFKHYCEPHECGTVGCALGLGKIFWNKHLEAEDFNMPLLTFNALFFSAYTYHTWDHRKVTPIMVADRIDAYLAETRK